MIRKTKMYKPCRLCDEMFEPSTRFCKTCDKCKEKILKDRRNGNL